MRIYLGIDNGVTGTITVIDNEDDSVLHFATPIKKELSYTKKKQYISRIDLPKLEEILEVNTSVLDFQATEDIPKNINKVFALIERPMINPLRWKASMSAIRTLEAILNFLEKWKIPYQYIDSKEWQGFFLPSGIVKNKNIKGSKKSHLLKKAAVDIAKRLFPKIRTKDADSLLIAEYARRKRF